MDAGAVTFPRRQTRQIHVGDVAVGGGAPISIQSMTTTKTADVEGTLQQIYALAAAGCDIVRCTCNEMAAAEGLAHIVPRQPGPDHRRHPPPVPDGAGGARSGGSGASPQPGQHPQARPHQGGGVGGEGPGRAHPHRRQRRLARPGAVRTLRRPGDARGDGRIRDAGARLLRRGRVRPREDLGEGVERAAHDRGVPSAGRCHRRPPAPRGHRGGAVARGLHQGHGRDRDAARRGDRRHHPLLAHRGSDRGGEGRAACCSSRWACASGPGRRSHRLPVVRTSRDRRDQGGRGRPGRVRRIGTCRSRSR